MQPYTPHGDSNCEYNRQDVVAERGCNLIPLTGTVTVLLPTPRITLPQMQPYTPHGDSNSAIIC